MWSFLEHLSQNTSGWLLFIFVYIDLEKQYTVFVITTNWQKQPPEVFCEKGVLRNFTKFSGKHLCQSCQPQACNFIKKETLAQAFSCKFCEISKNIFFSRTPLDDCFWTERAPGKTSKKSNLHLITTLNYQWLVYESVFNVVKPNRNLEKTILDKEKRALCSFKIAQN